MGKSPVRLDISGVASMSVLIGSAGVYFGHVLGWLLPVGIVLGFLKVLS